jgi:hypothetical protein
MNQLEVGTEIFSRSYGCVSFFGKIDRVTNHFAFCGHTKFKRQYNGMGVDKVGREKWCTTYYFIPNEDDKIELKKKALINKVVKFDYSKLSYDKICEIHEILIRP